MNPPGKITIPKTMDLLEELMNPCRALTRIYIPGGRTKAVPILSDDMLRPVRGSNPRRQASNTDYVSEYKKAEEDASQSADAGNPLSMVEDPSRYEGGDEPVPQPDWQGMSRVYEMYNFSHRQQRSLPIFPFKEKILSVIEANQVTVLQGQTGCGKSTQVPQYILDQHVERREPCNIVVTQPRRIAAISLAKRVAKERGWVLGSLVGYQIGLDKVTSEDTRITYMTTGVLLQHLISCKQMNLFTHVLLDEVHERSQDMDFLLIVIKKLLRRNSGSVRVVLMSATFNTRRFADYFSMPILDHMEPAPVINLDEEEGLKGCFAIEKFYLCNLDSLGEVPEVRDEEPTISDSMYTLAVQLILGFEGLDEGNKKGAVLVFLPGINEIEEMYNLMTSKRNASWWIRPLHSTITTDEQESVFRLPPDGYRKVILSTNIAESSITVPDIVYVVDFCLTKHLVCDQATNFSSLQLAWASHTNCDQRAGRAGRVSEGRVYRLVPKDFYEMVLAPECMPEMLRCPLENVVLGSKILGMGPPLSILALALDPPIMDNVQNTILFLKEVGGLYLDKKEDQEFDRYDGEITYMGRVMAGLPVDVRLTRLMLLGHVFSVLQDCIVMSAAMSVKSLFSSPFKERLAAYNSKLTWADRSCSDSIAFLNAYKMWHQHHLTGYFKRSVGGEQTWGRRFFIQIKVMREVSQLAKELKNRLECLGVNESVGVDKVRWTNEEQQLVLKVVMAGAYYPNYFGRGQQGGQVDEQNAVKQLFGKDPFRTVCLTGFPNDQPAELYVQTVKKAFKSCGEDIRVHIDGSSSKLYVEFGRASGPMSSDCVKRANIPGRASMAVYRAIKLRQLNIPIVVHLLTRKEANQRALELGLVVSKYSPFYLPDDHRLKKGPKTPVQALAPGVFSAPKPIPPSIFTTMVVFGVSHAVNPGKFWIQHADATSVHSREMLNYHLNRLYPPDLHPLSPATPIKVGGLYAVPFMDVEKQFYRARVDAVMPRPDGTKDVQVYFIDYGNSALVKGSEVFLLGPHLMEMSVHLMPAQALECYLAQLQPSLIRNSCGVWTKEACQCFQQHAFAPKVYGNVYSVVHGVLALDMYKNWRNGILVNSINELLVQQGFASPSDESYLSKVNHGRREQMVENSDRMPGSRHTEEEQMDSDPEDGVEPEAPRIEECSTKIVLHGPSSPLEMRVYGLSQAAAHRSVSIDWNSVNSVLLDTEPQDPHERLLVAQHIGENLDGDRITLRHTTVMPNIHGLAALMCLIFSPCVELRPNGALTKLVGALCGLGCEPNTRDSIYEEHDMVVIFDVAIDLIDIQNINRLRYWMNVPFHSESGDLPEAGPVDIISCQQKVKEFLFTLLKRKRSTIELAPLGTFPGRWGQVDPSLLLDPVVGTMPDRCIFPLHWGIELQEEEGEQEADCAMLKHIEELHELVHSPLSVKDIICNLCQVSLDSALALRIHLTCAYHRDRKTAVQARCSKAAL